MGWRKGFTFSQKESLKLILHSSLSSKNQQQHIQQPTTSTSTMASVIRLTWILALIPQYLAFTLPQFVVPKRPTTSLAVSTLSTATGEADRAFRLGIQLEKFGLARSASAAFHEAATLYQCFLDFDTNNSSVDGETNRFQHVTTLSDDASNDASNPNVRAVLAYACIRLA